MGLDMYIHASAYVSGFQHSEDEERARYDAILGSVGLSGLADANSPSLTVEVTIAYWRKANQIHGWFVREVQNGVDDCGSYYVSREKLIELRELCLRVLGSTELVASHVYAGTIYNQDHPQGAVQLEPGEALGDPRLARELLPVQEGFFFGGSDYDQYYWSDLKGTVEKIDRILDLPGSLSLEYHSSW